MPQRFTSLRLVIVAFFFLGGAILAEAHQPRLVEESRLIIVSEPEISKAYYGRLPNAPVVFRISSGGSFVLHAQVLVPATPDAQTDITLTVRSNTIALARLPASESSWEEFDEPFGGHTYFSGATFSREVPAGVYELEVSRPGNMGSYVLVVGKEESSPLIDMIRTLGTLPAIEKDFFGGSLFTAFFNLSGAIVLGMAVLLAGFLYFLRRIFRRRAR